MQENVKSVSVSVDYHRPSRCCQIPKRFILVGLGFYCIFTLFTLRVNLSVAIVSMTKHHDMAFNGNASKECFTPNTRFVNNEKTKGEFEWSEYTQGILLGSFFWVYIIPQIPAGPLAQRFGSKYILGYGVLFASLFSLVGPLAARQHYLLFIACRVMTGLCQGFAYPAIHAIIASWLPKSERGLMSTIIYSGQSFGTVVTMSSAGFLIDSGFLGGWPSLFYVYGLLGVIWFILWMLFVFDTPENHPTITADELKLILEERGDFRGHINRKTPWKSLLTSVPVWALVIAHFGHNWGFYTLLLQLPTYFESVLGFNIKEDGVLSSLPYLAQASCGCFVGFVFDKLIKKNILKVNTVRKICNSIGFIGPAICMICITFAKCNATLTVVLLTLGMAINGFYYSGFNVTHVEMSPDFAGSIMGLTNCIASCAGFLAPYVVGILTSDGSSLRSWSHVFYISAAIYVTSATIFVLFGSARLQSWGTTTK